MKHRHPNYNAKKPNPPKPAFLRELWQFEVISEEAFIGMRHYLVCTHAKGDRIVWNISRYKGHVTFTSRTDQFQRTWSNMRNWIARRMCSMSKAIEFLDALPVQPAPESGMLYPNGKDIEL